MEKMTIYNAVREVPQCAQKPIVGGRLKGKTDINPMWRIKALTEQFGACGIGWYYNVTKQWTEECGDEVCAFVNIELFIKVDGEWSKPIFGTGGNKLIEKESKGLYVSDECFKMATTDAISVACKQLGFGADIYWNEDRSKYNKSDDEKEDEERKELKKKLEPVIAELKRIGYSVTSICKTYKVGSIYDMSDLQIKDFLAKAKGIPDKQEA